VFFNIKPPTLGNTILLLVLNFEINLIIIGRLCQLAAVGTIGKWGGK